MTTYRGVVTPTAGSTLSGYNVDTFTGDGSDVTFSLTGTLATSTNIWVYLDGVHQANSNFSISAGVITFDTAPIDGSDIQVVYGEILDTGTPSAGSVDATRLSSSNSDLVAMTAKLLYDQGGAGSVARTIESKLQDVVSVLDYGASADGTNDQPEIQAAIDAVVASGGGVVFFPEGTYTTTSTLNFNGAVVKLKGAGLNASIIRCTSGHCITLDTTGEKAWLEDIQIKTVSTTASEGVGIYVSGDITVDFNLNRTKFITTTNAILCNLNADTGVTQGNTSITNCEFPESCTNSTGGDYISGVYHKIQLSGHKVEGKYFNISGNLFEKHVNQRSSVVELHIIGASGSGLGQSATAVINGNVSNNHFNGSTRECLVISDHSRMTIHGNRMNDSNRIGLSCLRGYRSSIMHNVCDTSAYRGYRIDYSHQCVWAFNQAYDTGAIDSNSVACGGMSIKATTDCMIFGNIIKAAKNSAILIQDEAGVYSTGNLIIGNKLLGVYTEIYNNNEANNTGNIIVDETPPQLEFNTTNVAVDNTTSEVTLLTEVLPAYKFRPGSSVRGSLNVSSCKIINASTLTIRLKYGSTTVSTLSLVNSTGSDITGMVGKISFEMFATSASAQEATLSTSLIKAGVITGTSISTAFLTNTGSSSEATTTDKSFIITAQYGVANAENELGTTNYDIVKSYSITN